MAVINHGSRTVDPLKLAVLLDLHARGQRLTTVLEPWTH